MDCVTRTWNIGPVMDNEPNRKKLGEKEVVSKCLNILTIRFPRSPGDSGIPAEGRRARQGEEGWKGKRGKINAGKPFMGRQRVVGEQRRICPGPVPPRMDGEHIIAITKAPSDISRGV